MVESSEGASMTSKGQADARNRHDRWKAGSSAGCMSGAINLVTKAMPKIGGNVGARSSAASSSQGPQIVLLPTSKTPESRRLAQPVGGTQPMAADESSESGNTVFYEDPNTQFHGCGSAAAADEERSYMNVGISDDSMSQATENKKPSKKVVSLTVEQGSESSGDTVFYEDPTAQAQELSHAAASSTTPIPPPMVHPTPVADSLHRT